MQQPRKDGAWAALSHTHKLTYTRIHTHACTHAHPCIHAHMHTCTHAPVHACTPSQLEQRVGCHIWKVYGAEGDVLSAERAAALRVNRFAAKATAALRRPRDELLECAHCTRHAHSVSAAEDRGQGQVCVGVCGSVWVRGKTSDGGGGGCTTTVGISFFWRTHPHGKAHMRRASL